MPMLYCVDWGYDWWGYDWVGPSWCIL